MQCCTFIFIDLTSTLLYPSTTLLEAELLVQERQYSRNHYIAHFATDRTTLLTELLVVNRHVWIHLQCLI
jgi:hypothetical protein